MEMPFLDFKLKINAMSLFSSPQSVTLYVTFCTLFYMVTVSGHCRQCRTLFSPIDMFSIVLRTIGPSLTSDPRLTSAGTSPVWAHTTYSKRGHFGHQDVKLERLKSMLSLVCLNWFSYISRTIQIVKYVDGRIGRYSLVSVPLNTIKHFTEEYCRL